MMKPKMLAYIGMFLLSLCLGGAATCEKKPPVTQKPSTTERATLERRFKVLEVKYEILLKDNPPQSETIQFRLDLSESRTLMDQGRIEEAESRLNKAESWIDQARLFYYDKHKAELEHKRGGKPAGDLSAEALNFLTKARQAKAEGDAECWNLYMKAAIEQAELGVLAYHDEPEYLCEHLQASKDLAAIYREAGDEQAASQALERSRQATARTMSTLRREIESCLEGTNERCRPELIGPAPGRDKSEFLKAREWLRWRNDLLKSTSETCLARQGGETGAYDYSAKIAAWSAYWENEWQRFSAGPSRTTDKEEYEKKQAARQAAYRRLVEEHNREYCQAGVSVDSLAQPPVEIVYQTHELRGDRLVIKGHVKNLSAEPIYNPKVTICGEVISQVERLGFYNMDPRNIGGFTLELKEFGVNEFREFGFRLPPYRIMVIYQDYYGKEHKLYKAISSR